MECQCTAKIDDEKSSREFYKTFNKEYSVERELTDKEKDCSEWCNSVCRDAANEYFGNTKKILFTK